MPLSDRTLVRIEEMIDEANIAGHPFVTAWRDGTLTRDDLRAFAAQFHQHVDAFPRYVSTIHSHALDPATRRTLLDLLIAAEDRSPTMSDLWLQTCAALGLFSDSVRAAVPTHATEACVNDFFYLCQSSTVAGLAALYTYVRLVPATVGPWREGLRDHHGLAQGPGVAYFDAAEHVAIEKAQALRAALRTAIDSESAMREAIGATGAALTAMAGLLAGALPSASARR